MYLKRGGGMYNKVLPLKCNKYLTEILTNSPKMKDICNLNGKFMLNTK